MIPKKIFNIYGGDVSDGVNKESSCSPGNDKHGPTCFTQSALKRIATKWNQKNSEDKIDIGLEKSILWSQLKKRFRKIAKCPEEWCWLDVEYVKDLRDTEITNKTFKPKMPSEWKKNMRTWLTTTDIADVLEQYTVQHQDFEFIGPVPIDFDKKISLFGVGMCVVQELCKIHIKRLYKKGKRKIGIVFNLDPHDQPGSHWVSMFVDFDTGGIYYFDSYGYKPCTEIMNLVSRIKEQGNKLILEGIINFNNFGRIHEEISGINVTDNKTIVLDNNITMHSGDTVITCQLKRKESAAHFLNKCKHEQINKVISVNGKVIKLQHSVKSTDNILVSKGFKYYHNTVRHQFKNSECGVYSIYYITQFLAGRTFDDISEEALSDDDVNKYRYYFYRRG